MTGKTTPLYVVCSPDRCVGKTLVARLLTEFYALADRPVAAFDLADEGPQLTDYLPNLATVADISDLRGQMAFFDRLIDGSDGAKIIDVSHRVFKNFCTVVREIGFSEEARRHAIEPRVLFIGGQVPRSPKSPNSTEAYETLQRSFTPASLVLVRNQIATGELSDDAASPPTDMAPAALDIPLLGFSLRALIDRQTFSFSELWRAVPAPLPNAVRAPLLDWMEGVFRQFRELDRSVTGEETHVAAPRSRRPAAADHRQVREAASRDITSSDVASSNVTWATDDRSMPEVPEQVRKFAPKKMRRADGHAMDHYGSAIVAKLQEAAGQLRAAEDRIGQLDTEIDHVQDRAGRAEAWLQMLRKEIEEKLIAPTAADGRRSMP
jgi:hypothetical protein